jgi:dTDP-4-dehydrorhamnose reductase
VKIAVTGHEGTIGSRLVKRGYIPLDCNITKVDEVFDTVSKVNPDVIIHCAAMTSVAWCEENEKAAFATNVNGTANVLESFAGKFIYLSTVHVFDGQKYWDYSEKPNAVNIYGLTKLSGESVVRLWDNPYTIIRISRTFDYESLAEQIGYLDDTDDTIEMPTFIKRSFVYTDHLVEGIAYVAENNLDVDLLNISGTHTLSYYNFWIQIAKTFGIDEKRIIPRKHEIKDYPRPFRGGLSVRKAKRLGVPLYSANDGLKLIKENT